MQMRGDVQLTDVNNQVEAPGTLGVLTCSQLAPAACAVTNSSPPAASDPATVILVRRPAITFELYHDD